MLKQLKANQSRLADRARVWFLFFHLESTHIVAAISRELVYRPWKMVMRDFKRCCTLTNTHAVFPLAPRRLSLYLLI